MLVEDFGHILEANVYISLLSDRVEVDPLPSRYKGIAGGNLCGTAQEKAGADHNVAFCCSSSLRSFFRATAKNLDVFSRLIPF
jgi:hypothetical protein